MSFASQVKGFVEKADTLTTKAFQGSCYQVSYDIGEESPVSTGQLLGSWAPSANAPGNYHFAPREAAWLDSPGGAVEKVSDIESSNRATAMQNMTDRLKAVTSELTKKDSFYLTNNVSYIMKAEHTGWRATDAYHMREKALINWQQIVNSVVGKLK